jgi:hypothetical protein
MAVINGTALLLYSEGVVIAYQKGVSVTVETDLPDATNKESAGWARHINGLLSAKIDFTALFSPSDSPVLGAKDLMNYIINRESLLVSILGLGYPIVGEADLSSLSFDAPQENTAGISGSMKVKGALYVLSAAKEFTAGTMVNLVTDPDGNGTDYDHFVISGTEVTSAINDATTAYADSNNIAIDNAGVYKLCVFLTLNSGQVPTVGIWDNVVSFRSNTVALAEGLNIVTLTATQAIAAGSLRFSNTQAADWKVSPIYFFKV